MTRIAAHPIIAVSAIAGHSGVTGPSVIDHYSPRPANKPAAYRAFTGIITVTERIRIYKPAFTWIAAHPIIAVIGIARHAGTTGPCIIDLPIALALAYDIAMAAPKFVAVPHQEQIDPAALGSIAADLIYAVPADAVFTCCATGAYPVCAA